MITELRVHNFKTLINATFALRRRHLLIGSNASGKTNVCLALGFLRLVAKQTLMDAIQTMPGGLSDFCNYAVAIKDRTASFSISATFSFDGVEYHFVYEFSFLAQDSHRATSQSMPNCQVVKELLSVTGDGFSNTPLISSNGKIVRLLDETKHHSQDAGAYSELPAPDDSAMLSKLYESPSTRLAIGFREFALGISYFNFAADRIRWGWRDLKTTGGLFTAGDNLAQQIFMLKSNDERRYRRMIDRVRRVEPRLQVINFHIASDQAVLPFIELEDGYRSSWLSLSDGTLRALALSFVFEAARADGANAHVPPPVLVIEEPENSLYAGELQKLLYDVDNVAPTAQVIFTSHSPYFIEQFDDMLESITVLKREKWHTSNSTLDHRRPEIEAALSQMSLGEQYFRGLLG